MIEPVFQMPLRVQVGPPPHLPGFTAVDWKTSIQALPDESVSELHCTHLPMNQAIELLEEANRVLVQGGRIDILVQDGMRVISELLEAMKADKPYALHVDLGLLHEKQMGRLMLRSNYDRVERITLDDDNRLYMIGYKRIAEHEESKEKEAS